MSRISQGVEGDANATAIAALSITYGTDDPGITPNNEVVLPDGDATAGLAEAVEDIVAKVNEIRTALVRAGIVR